MSTSLAASFSFAAEQISIYIGIPILVLGVFGSILATTVFLSLQTFRQNSCAFYLTVMQIFNTGQLLIGLLSRIMIAGFNVDLTQGSNILCKLRSFSIQACTFISITCLCLAIIDQYFATCSRPTWQQWSNHKLAHRLVIIFILLWFLHSILYLLFLKVIRVSSSSFCTTTNYQFVLYHNYFVLLTLTGVIPTLILIVFGCLAYRNVRQMNYRTVPLVRQELDKQLTAMVLLQALLIVISLIPYIIIFSFLLITQITRNPVALVYLKFFYSVFSILYYLYFAVNIEKNGIDLSKIFSFRVHFISIFVYRNDFDVN